MSLKYRTWLLHKRNVIPVWLSFGNRILQPISLRCCLGRCYLRMTAALIALSPSPTCAATFEFEGSYAIREIAQGTALEIAGTFSWALPQQIGIALAQKPDVRAIYLDSPGGHIKAALEVADLIHSHNLDTYVSHLCASACTI